MVLLTNRWFLMLVFTFSVNFIFLFSQTKTEIDSINTLDFNTLIKDLELSKKRLLDNIESAKKIKYKEGEARANQSLAIVYYYLGELEKGMECSIESVNYFDAKKDYIGMAALYSDIGFSIKNVDLNRGLEYFRMAMALGKKYDLGLLNSKIFNNYGTLMKQENKLDSALYYHKKSLAVCQKYNDTIGIPYSLNNMVVIYSAKKQFKKAFYYLDISDSYRKKEKNELSWADNIAYRADVYYDMNKTDSAIFYYEKALILAKKTNFTNLMSFCMTRLSELYEKIGNASQSLFYFKQLKLHEDSIRSVETNRAIASLQEEFNAATKEKKLVEQSLEIEQRKRASSIGIGVFVLILVVTLFLIRNQIRKRKIEVERVEQNKMLEQARIEKEFAEEKLRIGRELHDNIGSQLTFMISSVDNMVYMEPESSKKDRLNFISDFGRTTMTELRNTIWAMKNDGGELADLIVKVNELKSLIDPIMEFKLEDSSNRQVHFNAIQLLNTYRIIQESIQNALKYAEATRITVVFTTSENTILVQISDNGKGFEVEQAKLGNGLINMQTRAKECGGEISFLSTNSGTTIELNLPI